LFAHVRHMTWTTIPALALALVGFVLLGIGAQVRSAEAGLDDLSGVLQSQFAIGIHLLLPLLVVFVLAMRRFPAFPTIAVGALLGALFAVLFQPEQAIRVAGDADLARPLALL